MNVRSLIPKASHRDIKPMKGSPFNLLHQEISELFDRAFNAIPRERLETNLPFAPKVDVYETDKEINICADLPGIEEDNIKIELKNNVLTIEGATHTESDEKGKIYHVIERTYGTFRRSLALPYDVDSSEVEATFSNGVLKIVIPKPPNDLEVTKQIKIKKS